MSEEKNFEVVAVSQTHASFVQKIRECLGLPDYVDNILSPRSYAGGEFYPTFRKDITGKNIYIVCTQGPFQDPLDMIGRTAYVADAAKRAGANKITVVFTDLPFGRQDRGPEEDDKMKGQPNSTEVVAKIMKTNSVDRILTLHMHSEKIYGIYEKVYCKPGKEIVYNISPYFLLGHYLLNDPNLEIINKGENIVFMSSDAGVKKFVVQLRKIMGLDNSGILYCKKARKVPNKPDAVVIDIEDKFNFDKLDGKTVIVPDDIVDTGGTQLRACGWINIVHPELNHFLGKPKDVIIYATHAVFAGEMHDDVQETLIKTGAKEIILTNSRPYITHHTIYEFRKYVSIIRTARLFANAIVQCCEKDRHPDDYYKYDSVEELNKDVSRMYNVKNYFSIRKEEVEEITH